VRCGRYIGRKDGLPADKKTLQRPQGLSWPVVDVRKTMFVKEVQRRPQVKWLGAKPNEDDDDATGTYIAAPIHSPGAFIGPACTGAVTAGVCPIAVKRGDEVQPPTPAAASLSPPCLLRGAESVHRW